MHIDLEIDHDRRLVIARAQGALQLPDITGYFARLVFDQTLGYAKIFDGRMAWLDLADHHLGLLKGHVLKAPVSSCKCRLPTVRRSRSIRWTRRGTGSEGASAELQEPTVEDRDRMLDYARELDEQAALIEASIARSA